MYKRLLGAIVPVLLLIILYNLTEAIPQVKQASVSNVVPTQIFEIPIYSTAYSDRTRDIRTGFEDALNDLFKGSKYGVRLTNIPYYKIHDITGDESTPLLLTIGKDALKQILDINADIPVISTGIMDYSMYADGECTPPEEIVYHHQNLTGISSLPNSEMILTTIVESKPTLTSVSTFYEPNDSDSVYQSDQLKILVEEAGLTYNEIPILTPNPLKTEAANNDDSGFTHRLKEAVYKVCKEDSVIFIPAESSLYDYIDIITETSSSLGVPTVGGDEKIGSLTVVSLYTDPYDQGYRAGKQAYDILVEKVPVSSIPIEYVPFSGMLKMYSPDYASKMGMSFPKSFWDINVILEFYVPGTLTQRS